MSKPKWGTGKKGIPLQNCIKNIENFYSIHPKGTKSTGFVYNKKGKKEYHSLEEYKECIAMFVLRNL